MAAEESVKRAVRGGDVKGLTAERFKELRIELDGGLGTDQYATLHWACHHGKAEVQKYIDTQCCHKESSDECVCSLQVLQHVLELGASVHVLTRHGWTGAHICAIRGCAICLQVIV